MSGSFQLLPVIPDLKKIKGKIEFVDLVSLTFVGSHSLIFELTVIITTSSIWLLGGSTR